MKIIVVCFVMFLGTVVRADENPYLMEQNIFSGPFRAIVVSVVDADTIRVSVVLWPGIVHDADVRARGIDAPETRTTCEGEKILAEEAKDWVERMYPVGEVIRIEDIEPDPFIGRFVGDVKRWRSDRWLPLANELLDREYAEIWYPNQQDIPWCLISAERNKP